ncbi:hypothetical protein SDC9_09811 [bioreactor metagenome]|uniref:Uncharacterized protein n=1 Tax=bioreactor metagenome TaxID=1076179 RepID=A0A644TBL0_9ZZZZ
MRTPLLYIGLDAEQYGPSKTLAFDYEYFTIKKEEGVAKRL